MTTIRFFKNNIFRNKKAFALLTDIVIATCLFMIVLGYCIHVWNSNIIKLESDNRYGELMKKTYHLSDILVMSSGEPSGWEDNISSVKALGLASFPNMLSHSKLAALQNMSYEEVKEIFNLGIYEFSISISDSAGFAFYEYGNSTIEKENIVSERKVILDDEIASFYLKIGK